MLELCAPGCLHITSSPEIVTHLHGAPMPHERAWFATISIVLVIVSGICSGLTLGLLSLDRVDIEIVKRTGTSKQKWLASRVEPLLQDPHHLLVTLLLVNAACMETLPLFLDRLLNPVAAILLSVTAILIFGEIVPQAVCKRYGLHVGAYLSWLVHILKWVTAPVSWPIAKLLDWLLGHNTVLFRRAELRALLTLHAEAEEGEGEPMLTSEEVHIIHGALDMAHKTAEAAMTPLDKIFAVAADDILDRKLMERIIECGHSRIPVYDNGDRKNIIGLLLVKELVLLDLDQGLKVRECRVREMDHLVADTPLYSVLELFRIKRRHMASIAAGAPGSNIGGGSLSAQWHAASEIVGIITIEDVIEELLQTEIVDETDLYVDNLRTQEVPPTPGLDGHLPPELTRWVSQRKWPLRRITRQPSGPAAAAAVVAARQLQRNKSGAGSYPPILDV